MAVTPFRLLNCEPGWGLLIRLHILPFQCSASVPSPPPTAHISLDETAEMALNVPPPEEVGEGARFLCVLAFTPKCGWATCLFVEVALPTAPAGNVQALRKRATSVTRIAAR